MSGTESSLTIRRYREEDHDAVWELHNLALEAGGVHAGNGPWDDDLHAIPTAYVADHGEFLVGWLGGSIVAMGGLRRVSQHQAEIKRMRVDPRVQRQGFGRRILLRLEQRACELEYETIRLDTTIGQAAAQALYLAHGYNETRRTHAGGFDVIHFEKQLRSKLD